MPDRRHEMQIYRGTALENGEWRVLGSEKTTRLGVFHWKPAEAAGFLEIGTLESRGSKSSLMYRHSIVGD